MNKRKKILFTVPALLGGGAEKVIVNMINQIDIKNFNIFLLVLNKEGPLHSSITNDLNIIDLNISRTRYSLFKIVKAINRINPDIIFSTTQRMNIFILIASLFIKNKTKIFAREANMPSLLIKNRELTKTNLILVKFLYKYAYKVVAQTDEMKKDISETYSISEKDIITILNPIDYNFINKSINNSKDPFNHNYINIVASGRISKQKSYDVLIKALSIVLKKNNNFRLYILGDDIENLKDGLLKLIRKLNMIDSIFFEGFVDNPYPYYKYSDLFILSSKWEGFPNVVIENLYLEKPIITTNCIKYLSDLIDNGKNGFVVNVEDFKDMADKILRYKELQGYNSYNGNDINQIIKEYA